MRDRIVLAMAVVGGLIAFNAAAEEGSTMTAAHQAVTVFVETVASGEVRRHRGNPGTGISDPARKRRRL